MQVAQLLARHRLGYRCWRQWRDRQFLNFYGKDMTAPYTVFDVGANQGQYLHLLTSFFQPGEGEIHCFEPGKQTFERLAMSIARRFEIECI